MEFVEIPVYIARGIKNNDINLYDYVCDILNEAKGTSLLPALSSLGYLVSL